MSLSAPELLRVVAELQRLVGARVQKVSVTGPRTMYVEVREPGHSRLLLFETEPALSRLGVVGERAASPERPFAFQGLLRAVLIGARIDRITADPSTLSATFHLSTDDGPRQLVLEVDARGGLVAFVDAHGGFLGAMPPEKARERGLARGRVYEPPAAREPGIVDRFTPVDGEAYGYSAAIERHYGSVVREKSAQAARAALVPALRAARKRSARTIEKVREDLGRIDDASAYQRFGDLLKPVIHTLHRGATEAKAIEYGENGAAEVVVPLLPQLSPRENMERYYHLHKRLVRSADRVLERLDALERTHAKLGDVLGRAEATSDEAVLASLEDEARREGLLKERASGRAGGSAEGPRVPYRSYRSATGVRIWVGRNAKDNDQLTFKHARGNDFWLHARGLPGSHVIIPGTGPEGPDGETLLDAATLAAHFSSARGELAVDVAATRRKYVHKPKGAGPGSVQFTQERTVPIRLEADRLERLLKSEE